MIFFLQYSIGVHEIQGWKIGYFLAIKDGPIKDNLIVTFIRLMTRNLGHPCRTHINFFLNFLFKLTISIQIAILNGFRDMIDLEVWLCLQIGDGAGDFLDAIEGPG